MKKWVYLIVFAILLCLANPVPTKASSSSLVTLPTIAIVSVVRNTSVSIQTFNFPPDHEFDVLLGRMGTRGVNGVKVSEISSGAGGSFIASFMIPVSLWNQSQIAIRLQSKTNSKYFAYNWFYNKNLGTPSDTGLAPGATYLGTPSFAIIGVAPNQNVTIRTFNLPPNDQFVVNMGRMSTKGINGFVATTFNTGAGGSQTFTFPIPQPLYGLHQISVRIQSITGSAYFAYNWFFNR